MVFIERLNTDRQYYANGGKSAIKNPFHLYSDTLQEDVEKEEGEETR